MKLFKPNFWNDKNSFFSFVFRPISYLYLLVLFLKRILTRKNKFDIPIICIGNIYLGGTGKTPFCISLFNDLKDKNRNPVIIKKYYKQHSDEHEFILEKINNLILEKSRFLAVSKAIKKGFDTVILDDGFQDFSIKKDLNILCFNSNQLIGNGLVIPSGPLRENLSAIKK